MRQADVFLHNRFAGRLVEDVDGYVFRYDGAYLADHPVRLSASFPLQTEPFRDRVLFAFFDGLIPEGWLLDIAADTWKLDPADRMGLLLACCRDCIGAASIREVVP